MKDRSPAAVLEGRFAALAQRGLRDVRFDLAPGADLETACAEVNALYAAIDAGEVLTLDFKDSRR